MMPRDGTARLPPAPGFLLSPMVCHISLCGSEYSPSRWHALPNVLDGLSGLPGEGGPDAALQVPDGLKVRIGLALAGQYSQHDLSHRQRPFGRLEHVQDGPEHGAAPVPAVGPVATAERDRPDIIFRV